MRRTSRRPALPPVSAPPELQCAAAGSRAPAGACLLGISANCDCARQVKRRELEEEQVRVTASTEKLTGKTDGAERSVNELVAQLERETMEAGNHAMDQAKLEMELAAASQQRVAAGDELTRRSKEKERAIKAFKKATLALEAAQSLMPDLLNSLTNLKKEQVLVDANRQRLVKEVAAVRADIDAGLDKLLKSEASGKEAAAMVKAARKTVDLLEEDLVASKNRERELMRATIEGEQQREQAIRAGMTQAAKVKEAAEQKQFCDAQLEDLKKMDADVAKRCKQLGDIVELTKRQRDGFKEGLRLSGQSESEMSDKLKLVHSELEVQRVQSSEKDKLLSKARKEHHLMVTQRDKVRMEFGRTSVLFWDKQTVVEQQLAEIDVLNGVINAAERDMLELRKRYEAQVEQRNWAGLALIDRNDELCVLYEKSHVQEEVLLKADLELAVRDDEIRMLRIELSEAQRALEVTRRQLPAVPELDTNIALLQAQLLEARREREGLSQALEDPNNTSRWRMLEGRIPSMEELRAKASLLDERLAAKRELLLEKSLVLEEVSALAERLKAQAAEGKSETLELAKKMNEVQGKLRAATRSVMAAVAELSLYQATSIQLDEEREALGNLLRTARERFARGDAPTEDADREVARRLRELEVVRSRAAAAAAAEEEEDTDEPMTTAEQRPTAYMPVGWAIPRPYGGLNPPFKPSEQGSTMRHVRKPEPREIVL